MWLFFVTQYNSSLSSFVPNFRILSQLVSEKSLTEKMLKFSLERKKNEQIKGLIINMWLFFVTQYNSSLSSFVPSFRVLSQVVAEKSLTEKKFTDRQTNRQTNIITEKAKTNYPYILRTGGINRFVGISINLVLALSFLHQQTSINIFLEQWLIKIY